MLDLMGFSPKVGERIINSLTGMQDDNRAFQIGISIQPGNSGDSLLNKNGQAIGIVGLKLNELYAVKYKLTIPQNVNCAVKVSCLMNASSIILIFFTDAEPL